MTQKQCTESKTGWVHQVHSLPSLRAQVRPGRTHCAVLWRVVAPCCSLSPAVSWLGQAVSQRVSGPLRRVAALLRAVSQDTPSWLALSGHDTLLCIATQTLSHSSSACHDTSKCIVTRLSQPSQPSYHDTINCIEAQPQPYQGSSPVTIQILYRDTQHRGCPSWLPCHDTIAFVS